MTTYHLFSDPHLGTRRAAHTTRESSRRLTEALYQAALDLTQLENPVCLGDLFDRSSNPEDILVQGFDVASRCRWTLAGNHDCTNRADTITSLDALKAMGVSVVSSPSLSSPYFFQLDDALFAVPHHASQELFEQALWQAAEFAAIVRAGKASVLLLHCNYDMPEFMGAQDDTLNLSRPLAEQLLESFDHIFIGHEHKPSTDLGGRVVVLGNTHPTSSADISDKFVYRLEISDDSVSLEKEAIWRKSQGFREVRFGDLLGKDLSGVQFIDVFGMAEAEEGVVVADFIQQVWAAAPDALAVRNSVQGAGTTDVEEAEAPALEDLRGRIEKELQGSDLLDLFNELAKEVVA